MKRAVQYIKSFFLLDHPTRVGYSIIACLLVCMLGVRYYLSTQTSWNNEPMVLPEHVANDWVALKEKDSIRVSTRMTTTKSILKPFRFDPNTVTQHELVKMGWSPFLVKMFLNWREKGKVFKSKEDLKPLYGLKDDEYNQLAPYIIIDPNNIPKQTKFTTFTKKEIPKSIDINSTDAATLSLLKGIGDFSAQKVIDYRNALGGFYNMRQVLEAYKFKDSIVQMLDSILVFDSKKIKKINLNEATESQLEAHPYIGKKYAQAIINMRKDLKGYSNINQIKMIPLMNEENYRKIATYCYTE